MDVDTLPYRSSCLIRRLLRTFAWCLLITPFGHAQASLKAIHEGTAPPSPPAIAESAGSSDQATQVTKPVGRPTIGLALEGGGALGLAHIGVLQWFEENRIPVDRIAGTSMGALVGGLYSSGHSVDYLKHLVASNVFSGMFTLRSPYSHLSFRRREDRDVMPQAFSVGLAKGRVSFGNAAVADDQLNKFLTDELIAYDSPSLDYDHLPTPFRCVATDLTTLQRKVFASGPLTSAVRSSIAIPGIFPPVRSEDDIFVDGAIVDNLPVDVLRDDLHAQVLIAVHLADAPFTNANAGTLLSVFARAYQAGTARNEDISQKQAEIVLMPRVGKYTASDYNKSAELVEAGYDAAEAQRGTLMKYALSESDWRTFQEDRATRMRSGPRFIHEVRVEGPPRQVTAVTPTAMKALDRRSFDLERTDDLMKDIRGAGSASAYYDTFSSGASPVGNTPAQPDDAIQIHLRSNWDGPPYLLVGADAIAMSSNVSQAVLGLRYVHENLGGYGSELRADAQLGYFTHLRTEYYYKPLKTDFFLLPHVAFTRDPVYLWQNQKRISERFEQNAGGGLDLGWAPKRDLQAALTYDLTVTRWTLVTGADDSPTQHLSGTAQRGGVHVTFSNELDAIATPKGTEFDTFVGSLFHTAMSATAPMVTFHLRQSWNWSGKNVIHLSGEGDSYFHKNVADPFRFTLGGPLRLYASSIGEYRGTDLALERVVYLRRLATLPTGLGDGLYLVGGLEAGSIWSPQSDPIERQDFFTGMLISSPFGALTLGGSVGDAGRRKVFFTFGRLF
jgi:NTE family protein